MNDLYEDLRDGSRLSMLIELLTGEKLVGYMYMYIHDGVCACIYYSIMYISIRVYLSDKGGEPHIREILGVT